MKRASFYTVVGLLMFNFLILPNLLVQSYDDRLGVEYDDTVNVTCTRIIDHKTWEPYIYTPDYPLTIVINPESFNENFINELLGMKLGETKELISWYVTQEDETVTLYEYHNTTIIEIVKDSTPGNSSPAGGVFLTIIKVASGIGIFALGVYGFIFILRRLKAKSCISCSTKATSKCAKCGVYYCSNCSTKGCKDCGSTKYVRM
jgi:hypothetical protein